MTRILVILCLLSSCMPTMDKDKYSLVKQEKQEKKAKHEAKKINIKLKSPKLIGHDLGRGKEIIIAANRIYFSFTFDQDLVLASSDALKLECQDEGQALLSFDKIELSQDKRTLLVSLPSIEGGAMIPGQKYAFIFGSGIKSSEGAELSTKPLEFLAGELAPNLQEYAPLSITPLHNGAEITWLLNNLHKAKISFGLAESDLDCLGKTCLNAKSLKGSKQALEVESHLTRVFITGLKPETRYYYDLAAFDLQGKILRARGNFLTHAPARLRISEIMIKPKVEDSMSENAGEYIELQNISQWPMYLSGLSLSLEKTNGIKQTRCSVEFDANEPEIAPGGFALIVGQDFLPELYELNEKIALIRLNKKTICGGLANDQSSILKIYGPSGRALDRFGAFLWPGLLGVSISRSDVLGLEEAHNYCYSSLADGPTPGRANGALGECAKEN